MKPLLPDLSAVLFNYLAFESTGHSPVITVWDIIRDSAFGQCLRIVSSRRVAKYPEKYTISELPAHYLESRSHGGVSYSSTEPNTDTEAAPERKSDQRVTVISWYSDNNDMYAFNLGQLGLVVAVCLLCAYFYFVQPKRLRKLDPVPPEARIWPGLFVSFLIPIGLSLFAWTARPSIHRIVSLVGIAISMCGVFVITQCMFIYLTFTYPRYAGSMFAANGFARSLLAGASILFSVPMFDGIQVSGGVTLLASFSVLGVLGMFALYYFGAALRKRSRFSGW